MAVSETFHLRSATAARPPPPIADQSAYQGQDFSLDVSSHFARSCRRRHPDILRIVADRPQHRCPYRHHLRRADPRRLRQQSNHRHGYRRPWHGDERELPPRGRRHQSRVLHQFPQWRCFDQRQSSWTDTVDLHNIGQNASFNVVELAPDGHTVQSWTDLVVSGSAQSDHNLTLAQGDHAIITINHTDGSATDHIALQNIDHIRY